jgi:hypothetical protein
MQAYSLCAFSSDAPFCISTYAPASYRIATENPVVVPEEPEEQLEVQPQEVPEANEEDVEELSECPDHRPSFFERGKPQSISPSVCNYLIDALL